jgi:hypothetical protein
MLAYDIPTDLVDDNFAMGEIQAIMCVELCCIHCASVWLRIFDSPQC